MAASKQTGHQRERVATKNAKPLPAAAQALGLFRILKNGEGRNYTATTFPANPYQGCERMLRLARAVGWVGGDYHDSYGLLEILDINGDVIDDFPIPTAPAFAALKKKLNIAVEPLP